MEKNIHINNQPHSAEYFDEARSFWWNSDFIDLMATRLKLTEFQNILDIGCGLGHWGQVLAPVLCKKAKVIGVDREHEWVSTANRLVTEGHIDKRFSFIQGDVMSLPFKDESFDFVTGQTVLIHLKDPVIALKEIKRVLKPGGLLLSSEPNNLANATVSNNVIDKLSIDDRMIRIKNNLRVQKGKEVLGEGFNSLGDLVPGQMASIGFKNITVHQSDKSFSLIPPYSTEREQAVIKTKRDWVDREFTGWHRDDLKRYFLAGGGSEEEYDEYVKLMIHDTKSELDAIDKKTFHSAGGNVCYLISGYKEAHRA